MQHPPTATSPPTPACASNSSSVSGDALNRQCNGADGSDCIIPQSVKGAPEHLRPAIRKRQNSEVRIYVFYTPCFTHFFI